MFPVKQLIQKVVVQGVAAIGPFLVLPIISRASGEGEWSAFVLGQTAGLLVGVLASFGWPISGISQVARAGVEQQSRLFVLSVTTRLLAFVGYMPVVAIILYVLSPRSFGIALVVAVGTAFSASLNVGWFFVAVGTPFKSLLYGVVPVLAAAGATSVLVLAGQSTAVHGLALSVATAAMLSLVLFFEIGPDKAALANALSFRSIVEYYRAQVAISASQVLSAIYVASPMFVASWLLASSDSDSYATASRIMVISTTLILSSGSVLQAWVSASEHGSRARVASLFTLAIGSIGCVGYMTLGPWISSILFGSDVSTGRVTSICVGLYILLTSTRVTVQRYFLVPAGRYRVVLLASAVGLGGFTTAAVLLVTMHGSATILLLLVAVLVAEICISATQVVAASGRGSR